MAHVTIGEAARQARVNIQTIRFYERRGLLPTPARTASNYRTYTENAVRRVRFIKRAQELGFTLKEVAELLALRATTGSRVADVRRRAEAKVRDIDEKVRALAAMREALTSLVCECSETGAGEVCPILEALDNIESET